MWHWQNLAHTKISACTKFHEFVINLHMGYFLQGSLKGVCGTGGSESTWGGGGGGGGHVGLRREEGPLGRDEGGHARLTNGMEWGNEHHYFNTRGGLC